ncbi:MAG TPA: Uma2 family endonuclease [Kofleriaceae bacterium]|nr:Uma2 family endonuclease [Kofleriaceae bacterium]
MLDFVGFAHTIDTVPVPRTALFPIEVAPPDAFRFDEPTTWPATDGRFEFVGGRLLYMPPCGDVQQDVSGSVAVVVGSWAEQREEFAFGSNEAGMLLDGDVRAADAAVWRRDTLGPHTGGYRRVAPILAIEVAGQQDREDLLREKSIWYLAHGVSVVWLILPDRREIIVLQANQETRLGPGQRLPEHAELPGLAPDVDRFFRQLP